MVGARRGYTSASPSATAQNFSDDPAGLSSEMVCRSIHCLVAGSRCEQLTTTRHPLGGGRLTSIGCIPPKDGSTSSSLTSTRYAFGASKVVAARAHIPRTRHGPMVLDQRYVDREFRRALDELLGAVKRVDQDETVRIDKRRSGASFFRDDRQLPEHFSQGSDGIISSASRSAAVTGEPSSLYRTLSPASRARMIALPARTAIRPKRRASFPLEYPRGRSRLNERSLDGFFRRLVLGRFD